MQDKFSDRGFGQGINKIFQEGDMDGDYCKNFRRGKCTGKNVNNQEKKSKFLFFHQFLAIFQLIFVLDFLQRGD